MTGEFIHNPDQRFPLDELLGIIRQSSGSLHQIPATGLAKSAFGDTMTSNMIILGYAYQAGAVPIPALAIERAIELNGRAVRVNIEAFHLGRQLHADEAAVLAILDDRSPNQSLEDSSPMGLLARRSALLLESHGQSNARQLDH